MDDQVATAFGDLAVRLEPRALLAGVTAAGWDARRVRVAFRGAALPQAARPLAREAGLALRDLGGGMEELTGPRDALAACAASPELRVLLDAHTRATAALAPARVMGVVNVTPDSFSDGGRFLDPARAIDHGLELWAKGADILDVGGESTRPGARGVEPAEETERVLPVVHGLAVHAAGRAISIDTRSAEVAEAALDAGATMVNDVSAGRHDPHMLALVAERGCDYVAMHMDGSPAHMQDDPGYTDVVREVTGFLRERVRACLKAGVALPRIVVDPGIGFGKRLQDNLDLIRATGELRSLGVPVLLGVSRKSFLGSITGAEWQAEKPGETAAAVSAGVLFGAEILRVHDAGLMEPAVRVARALMDTSSMPRNERVDA